jgi:hypothetical protein
MTAIELFLEDRDPVSVQALAGNARELLEQLCRQAGVTPMTELLLQDHPGKPKKDLYAAMNLYRNCFKHLGDTEEARQEDQRTLNQFTDTKNDYLLYCGRAYRGPVTDRAPAAGRPPGGIAGIGPSSRRILRCRRSFGPRRENDLSHRGLTHVSLLMACSATTVLIRPSQL